MIERTKYLEELVRWKDKDLIKVVTGIRRCGKSVILKQIISEFKRVLRRKDINEVHYVSYFKEEVSNNWPIRIYDALIAIWTDTLDKVNDFRKDISCWEELSSEIYAVVGKRRQRC